MNTITAYAGVARAPFLLLPFTLIAVGSASSFYQGGFSWLRTLIALVGLVALHMAVNIFNEWSDLRSGIDLDTERTPFSGGSGTLPSSGMPAQAALIFGCCCAGIGLATGLWFLSELGLVMVPFLVLGAVAVVSYTDIAARLGVGELIAGLGLGGLPVIGAAVVQDGYIGPAAWAAAVPAFLMTFNLLLLNEFPDEVADRKGGRRNLVLIFGRGPSALIYVACGVVAPLSIVAAVLFGFLPVIASAAVLPSLFLVAPLRWAMKDPQEPVPIPALGANVIWNLASNSVLAICLVIAV